MREGGGTISYIIVYELLHQLMFLSAKVAHLLLFNISEHALIITQHTCSSPPQLFLHALPDDQSQWEKATLASRANYSQIKQMVHYI